MYMAEQVSNFLPHYYYFFKDGIADKEKAITSAITTISVPRSCLQHPRKNENLFSLELPADRQTCPIDWKPLDACRKYRFDVSSQYSAWNSPSSSWEIFTGQEGYVFFEISLPVSKFATILESGK
jgi:hypothetical protein